MHAELTLFPTKWLHFEVRLFLQFFLGSDVFNRIFNHSQCSDVDVDNVSNAGESSIRATRTVSHFHFPAGVETRTIPASLETLGGEALLTMHLAQKAPVTLREWIQIGGGSICSWFPSGHCRDVTVDVPWERGAPDELEETLEQRRMEGSSLQVDDMQKVPIFVVHERMSQGEKAKCTKEKKKVKGWPTEEMKNKANILLEEDTEEMRKRRGMSQDEMDQCWKSLAERMEEEVLDKYKVDDSKREAFKGRGAPLEWRRVRRSKKDKIGKWKEDWWARIFALFREYNLQRLQSKQEESTEGEEMMQQQRMRIVKDLTRKIRSKGRMDAESRWWVTELLAADCENAWIHPGWEDTMQMWYEWLEKMKKVDKGKIEERHQQ